LHAVLFLSDQAAHAGIQARPAAWSSLSESELLDAVREHGATVAAYYRSLGLDIEVFQIGNEIDFGICGVRLFETLQPPPGVDALNDPAWMRDNLWVKVGPILKAAIEGVRSVYPGASVLLHVAGFGYSNDNIAASAFFQSMDAHAVPFDIAGLSYPYMFIGSSVPQPYFADASFLSALDRIASLGRPIEIVEFAYPSKPEGTTTTPAAAYPFTPTGQAAFVRDFIAAVKGRVRAVHYFYPDYYNGFSPGQPELEGCGLFASPGIALPALNTFNAVAEGEIV
jgi:arabinogalactan endo-1,4-beta-galactosidase